MEACPGHAVPPFFGRSKATRFRVLIPEPQDWLHVLQLPHSPQWQFTGQGLELQSEVSRGKPSQGLPPKMACTFTLRSRVFVPFPQVFVQDVHRSQSDHTQSTGQPSVLQGRETSDFPWHALPPNAAGVVMLRRRTRVPPPHVLLQFDQGLHSLHSQSTGQPSRLHRFCSWSPPWHSVPPFADSSAFRRVRMVRPPPHVLEQSDQLPQVVHSQFTGQPTTPQLTDSRGEPSHCLPPLEGWTTTVRFRSMLPPPHVAEHPGHSVQGPHWQSMMQGWSMQSPCSLRLPEQSLPPYFACTARSRSRDFVPFPQDAEHGDQDFHSSHTQLTAQGSVLQSIVSLAGPGQALPPPQAFRTSLRVLVALPEPHVFEHALHLAQGPHLQATGQGPLEQTFVSFDGPMQHLPPCAAFLVTFLTRWILPPPHVAEQLDHRFHSPHLQSIGQGLKLQASSTEA
mmetsp:Transcript_3511/g.11581  ORF Transcript_3511/g.11581 Transcript_3511/m.11581 type:complete len:452 (-) Transcript_3511:558-1913(-)